MVSLKQIFQNLAQSLKRMTPQQRVAEKARPSGFEVGLRHPDTGGFLLLQDTGSAELNTGVGARLLLQAQNGSAVLEGTAVALAGKEVHLHANRLWMHGWQQFDPLGLWYSPPMPPPGDPTWTWRLAPLVAQSQEALGLLLATPLLYGDPANLPNTHPGAAGGLHSPGTGQHNLTLGSLIRPQPLFGPNRQMEILMKHLADLGKQLSHG